MKMTDCIRKRRSVRTFDGSRVSGEELKRIMDFAGEVQNPYGIPITWLLLDGRGSSLSSPVISGTDQFITGKMKAVPHAEEAFGYSFEEIVLFAEKIGLGTTWIAGTMNRQQFEQAAGIGEDEVMPCISPLGHPAKKMSLRETMMRKGVRADSRMDFGKLFFDGSFDTPLSSESAGNLLLPLEMVRLAPSAVNKQPWRIVIKDNGVHFYERSSKGYVSAAGWDLQKIDIGIALCHFAGTASELGIKTEFSIEDPKIDAPAGVSYVASYLV